MISRPSTSSPRLAPLLLLLCAGCVINGDKWPRPRDLSPAWLVDRPRLLAVRADPPEVRPGEQATFEALLPTPGLDAPLTRIWFACPPEDPGGIGFGCFLDLGGLDIDDPADLFEQGLIGVEPGLPPRYTVAEGVLDDLTEPYDRQRGRHVLVQVAALPDDLEADDAGDIDFNELEVGYKRLVVSEAPTPNRNPEVVALRVEDHEVEPGVVVHVEAGQRYDIEAVLADDAVETYDYLNRHGDVEQRTEEPYASWFATGGTITRSTTLHPHTWTTWTAPESGERGTWYVVVRDRRGGMAWRTQEWAVR